MKQMTDRTTIGAAATSVLDTAIAADKACLSRHYARLWAEGGLDFSFLVSPNDKHRTRPARPLHPQLLPPRHMPKRRAGGSRETRIALLHAIAHIELNAIDLAWDIVARFGHAMPRDFTDDWVQVADDEARHFDLLTGRLADYGAAYGDLPAHDGVWQSAQDTAHDLLARLAVVPLVLEARGLDVTPAMITRFEKAGDQQSAQALSTIYMDEIGHVGRGQKWFNILCREKSYDPQTQYHDLVRRYFKGRLKPPFNQPARQKAGMPDNFYL